MAALDAQIDALNAQAKAHKHLEPHIRKTVRALRRGSPEATRLLDALEIASVTIKATAPVSGDMEEVGQCK